jgi:hypothetical protein
MSTEEYRAEADRLREATRNRWTIPDARQTLLQMAQAYEALARADETLAKLPISGPCG